MHVDLSQRFYTSHGCAGGGPALFAKGLVGGGHVPYYSKGESHPTILCPILSPYYSVVGPGCMGMLRREYLGLSPTPYLGTMASDE